MFPIRSSLVLRGIAVVTDCSSDCFSRGAAPGASAIGGIWIDLLACSKSFGSAADLTVVLSTSLVHDLMESGLFGNAGIGGIRSDTIEVAFVEGCVDRVLRLDDIEEFE